MTYETAGDMGPFAGMDKALYDAVSRYGTPPHRQKVTVTVREVDNYSFDSLPTTIEEWIEWLTDAREETPEEYRAVLNCVCQYERGCYDSGDSASFNVWYERPETDAEMTERVNRGIAYVRENADKERLQYEALKRKFETSK